MDEPLADGAGTEDTTLILPKQGMVVTSEVTGNTYTMGSQIGEGGFGIVYACEDVWKNQLVAKILKKYENGNNIKYVAMEETRKLLHVRHPNIIHVYDAFYWNGGCYIISERCYKTLSELLDEDWFVGKFWVKAVARCILQAIHFAHVQQLIHCDIHCGNVMLRFIEDEMTAEENKAMTFKLGDFGLAKTLDNLDSSGVFLDSIRPPEAIEPAEFGPIDHRVDIYHVGLLLLQLQFGEKMLFSRDEILSGKPREVALGLPSPFSFALEKALRRHTMYRTSSALELWRDLNSQAN